MAHKHTFGKPAGYGPMSDAMLQEIVAGMRAQLADPNSQVNSYTRECRAKGIPCMQDQLDAGVPLEEIARKSVFVK